MEHLHPWDCRVQAEGLRSYPLEDVVRALGYSPDPEDDARWRRPGSVVSINGFMFYDHLCGEWGAGAVDLVVHVHRCSVPDALAFLSELQGNSRRTAHRLCPRAPSPLKPARSQRQWPQVQRHLVDQRGLSPVLVALCRDLGLLYADRQANAVFLCRNAAGEETGTEILPTGAQRSGSGSAEKPAPSPLTPGNFWMSWGTEWPLAVLFAKNAIDALSALSLQLVPATRKGCAVVSTAAVPATIPIWIEAWNPRRIFCAYDATRDGDDAAQRLLRRDNRVVRVRPALDGDDWNDMLMRDRLGEPLETDDRRTS